MMMSGMYVVRFGRTQNSCYTRFVAVKNKDLNKRKLIIIFQTSLENTHHKRVADDLSSRVIDKLGFVLKIEHYFDSFSTI